LIAVGSEHRLGVDLEQIRNDVDANAPAERFFSLHERAGLLALPDRLRAHGFYACWTRKEALKATVTGFLFRSRTLPSPHIPIAILNSKT
jgi:4'-phosphopantetheinyl transferase